MMTRILAATFLFPLFLVATAFGIPQGIKSELSVPEILDASALKDGSDGKPAVDPCQDFYRFSCGQWIEKTAIPADKDRIMHQSTALIDKTDENLNRLILKLAAQKPSQQTSASKQISDYYMSCMNFAKTTPTEFSHLQKTFTEVNQLPSKQELTPLLAKLHLDGTSAFFSFGSGQDPSNSSSVIGILVQSGMALPEPSYYLDADAKSKEIRKKYTDHITKILALAGQEKKSTAAAAKAILAIETKLAEKAMSFDDRQNPAKVNHPITREALTKLAPAINWATYFEKLSVPAGALNLNQPEFFRQMSEVIAGTSLADLKTYLVWQIVNRSASHVSPSLDQANFDFWSSFLRGEKKMKPRWKRCTQAVESKLGYALAEVYVKTVDAGAIRAKVEAMIASIQLTFRNDLEDLSIGEGAWLDQTTKIEALRKLDQLKQKVGAPEQWRNYSSLSTDQSSYYLNDIKTNEFEGKRDLEKIGKPLDRQEWYMMPWEINAYYDPPNNEFVFPFGILQPPSFDLKASDGANLGAFGGGTIGHELTHGFDSDGRQFDADGNVKDWWTDETKKHFEEKTQCYVRQADEYKIKSVGLNVDGKKTLTENLADQGGVKLGYMALLALQAKRAPALPWLGKYSENQQYWIAYAQSWCGKARPQTLREQIKTNPHPPEEFRVNGVVGNRPEFARDFACKEGSRMAPKVRCSLW